MKMQSKDSCIQLQLTSDPSLGSPSIYTILFSTELWISALFVAVYCSSALNAIPGNNAAVGETMEDGGPNQLDYKRSTPACGYESECDPIPCQNGGTCIGRCCSCTSSYTGYQCQYRQGRLTFYARYGRNLSDKDELLAGPYMKFVAYDVYGNSYEKMTSNDHDKDPAADWYENIDFGIRPWKRFEVSVWGVDAIGSANRLSDTQNWDLPSNNFISADYVTHEAYQGFVKFDFMYT